MLDEPTNHLDPESIEWVAEFLENFGGTFLVVTHDRYFLDRVANRILELCDGRSFSRTPAITPITCWTRPSARPPTR
jgi:ABC transport system ATP-binding/permease protein